MSGHLPTGPHAPPCDAPSKGAAATVGITTGFERLPETDDGLRTLLRLSCDWYWRTDACGRLVERTGNRPDDPLELSTPLGMTPWEWSAAAPTCDSLERLRVAFAAMQPFRSVAFQLRDANGLPRYLSLSGEPIFSQPGEFAGHHGTAQDVTEVRRSAALVRLEHAVARHLAEASTSRRVMQAVMKTICESEDWETAGYFKKIDESGTTQLIAGWAGPGFSATASEYYRQSNGKEIPAGGMLSRCIQTGKPVWVACMTESQTTWAERLRHTGERATFFFPVLSAAEVLGVFAFTSRQIREPDSQLLQSMQSIGEQSGQFLLRKDAEQVLRQSEARFKAMTQLASDWYWEMDAEHRLTRLEGQNFEGCESEPNQNPMGLRRWETGLHIEAAGGWQAHREALESRQTFRDVVLSRSDPQGNTRYFKISGEPIVHLHGDFGGYRGVGRDITEAKRAEQQVIHLATHDVLTGLPNRLLFDRSLQREIRGRSTGTDEGLAVLFIDLDGFKAVNDRLGHEIGDELLKVMAERFRSSVRSKDMVARLGGDEFVAMLVDVPSTEDLDRAARRLLQCAKEPVHLAGTEIRLSASVGVSRYGIDAHDAREILKNADHAMYAAKLRGKNAIAYFSGQDRGASL